MLKTAPVVVADPDRVAAPQPSSVAAQDSVRLQEAVTLLEQGMAQKAIAQLKPLAQGTPGHWSAGAQWYLALAYLKNDQHGQARPLIGQIAELPGHPYQAEARALLQQLNTPLPNE